MGSLCFGERARGKPGEPPETIAADREEAIIRGYGKDYGQHLKKNPYANKKREPRKTFIRRKGQGSNSMREIKRCKPGAGGGRFAEEWE